MSLYILEGPRSSGKTTIVEGLRAAFGANNVRTFKFERTKSPPIHMVDFLTKYYLALVDSRTICVIDRFHLTEYVMRYLDKKVPLHELIVTTSMIDIMLKHIGAITYILDTKESVRLARTRTRSDPRHRKLEWPNIKELDAAWKYVAENFSASTVRVMASNTQADADKIVIDIMKAQAKQTHLLTKMSKVPPFKVETGVA